MRLKRLASWSTQVDVKVKRLGLRLPVGEWAAQTRSQVRNSKEVLDKSGVGLRLQVPPRPPKEANTIDVTSKKLTFMVFYFYVPGFYEVKSSDFGTVSLEQFLKTQ